MTHFSRAFTGITSLATGIFLILLTTASLRATVIHAQIGNTTNAAITLSTALVLFFVALFFALPTARRKLIYATFSGAARALFGTLFIAFFGVIAALLAKSPNLAGNPLLLGASQTMVLAALGCLVLAFLLTFVTPGFAYSDLRNAYREMRINDTDHASNYASAIGTEPTVDRRGPLAKILSFVFGLAAVSVVGLAGYGLLHALFIASAAHVEMVRANSLWIILGYGMIIFGSLYFGKKGRGLIRNPALRIIAMFVFFAPISFFAIPAAQYGLPAILSLQEDGRYDRIEVTVVERGRESGRRTCDRRATVVWEVHNRKLCNVPEKIWRELQPGQTLELQGFLTEYGFRYDRIRRAS